MCGVLKVKPSSPLWSDNTTFSVSTGPERFYRLLCCLGEAARGNRRDAAVGHYDVLNALAPLGRGRRASTVVSIEPRADNRGVPDAAGTLHQRTTRRGGCGDVTVSVTGDGTDRGAGRINRKTLGALQPRSLSIDDELFGSASGNAPLPCEHECSFRCEQYVARVLHDLTHQGYGVGRAGYVDDGAHPQLAPFHISRVE
jgi:hypothetical protein